MANPEDWKDFLEIFVVESFSLLNKNVTVAEKAFIVVGESSHMLIGGDNLKI